MCVCVCACVCVCVKTILWTGEWCGGKQLSAVAVAAAADWRDASVFPPRGGAREWAGPRRRAWTGVPVLLC